MSRDYNPGAAEDLGYLEDEEPVPEEEPETVPEPPPGWNPLP